MAVLAACTALAGCMGGPVLPREETDVRALYARAYGDEAAGPSAPLDVRVARFCEALAARPAFGSADRRLARCLETAAAAGLVGGVSRQADCEGADCDGRVAVEARLPPPLHPGWSGAAAAGVERVFPRLANPDVLVYVYPHVATGLGVGVPGYLTALPLFDRVEYALPGERVSVLPPAEWPAWEAGADAPAPRASPRFGAGIVDPAAESPAPAAPAGGTDSRGGS